MPHVLYLGRVSRQGLLDTYDGRGVFLLSSQHESFGMVSLSLDEEEACHCHSFCNPVAAIIKDGEDGFLCGHSERIALESCIYFPTMAKKLGEAGYVKAVSNYTWDCIGKRVYDFYRKIVHQRSR